MDRIAFVHRRKKRYMAILLTLFEQEVEPHLPPDVAERFKGRVREKMHALALDAAFVMGLRPGEEVNQAAVELRDQVDPSGRHTRRVNA